MGLVVMLRAMDTLSGAVTVKVVPSEKGSPLKEKNLLTRHLPRGANALLLTLVLLNKLRCHAHSNFQPIRLLSPG